MVRKVTAGEARQNLGQLLERVFERGDQYVIERAGQPMAAVVPVWFLEDYRSALKRLATTVTGVHERTARFSASSVEREVAAAVTATRKSRRRRKA